MATKRQLNLIRTLAIKRGLDPEAVFAVARQEGLSGGVGDQGTSFGPFQLHKGGALPAGIPLKSAQSWAWSPVGLKYALDRMASVASGLTGGPAIQALVRRFERPAAPDREIAGALAAYGGGSVPNSVPFGVQAPPPSDPSNNPLLEAVLHGRDLNGVIRSNALRGSVSPSKPLPYTQGTPIPSGTLPGILGQVVPAELLNEGIGGPTHSTGPHIHAAYTNPQAMLAAIQLAESLGLHVGENPYTDTVDPVHAKNSYHYRTFPGLFGGKHLGQAADFSGPNAAKLYALLSRHG